MPGILIAFSGKGGSGKTTLAALLVRELIRTGKKPVLAVDADANATLGMALGVSFPGTIADLREEIMQVAQEPGAISKERLMDQWLAELLSEQAGFDLLTMGRPEGPRCYCYVNGLLRRYLSLLRGIYPYLVVDCQAGMEYLSRLTVENVDTLVLTAEPTAVGIATARLIAALADTLPVRVGRRVLALNKVTDADANVADSPGQLPPVLAVLRVPFDEDFDRRWVQGEPIEDEAQSARAAIEQLAHLCLDPDLQRASRPEKEPTR